MQELIAQKIAAAIGAKPEEVSISVPERDEFGHYSTNVAMRLAKEAKKAPLVLAEEFVAKLQADDADGVFSKIEAVKPGFINLWVSENFLQQQFALRAQKLDIGAGQIAIIEFSDPNIAKPMHVGHSRPTFIGAALANIYEAVGYKVVRWNYIGDWGTQFGKLIAAYKMWGNKEDVQHNPIATLVALYVRFHEEMKTKPELEKQGQEEFRKLEEGNKENRLLWEWFKDESLLAFNKTYAQLGTTFDVTIGEAYYESVLYDTFKQLKETGLAVPGAASADATAGQSGQIIHLEQFGLPPALIQKSDGASLYITRDIAGLKHRLSHYKPAKIMYVVANEQALHFQQLFAIAKLLGLESAQLEHVKFGMVLGEDGKKLSTREGKTVLLQAVLDEAVQRAYDVVTQKNPSLKEAEKKQIAQAVGVGALKYNDLKENRNSDIRFDWEQMLDFNGDSAPYLQYTVVRLKNIVRKAADARVKPNETNLSAVDDALKPAILKKVLDFNDVVALCAQTCYTSHLAKYLFEFAKLGNHYYETVRILEDENKERQAGRLALIAAVSETLTNGLSLLGIQVPERI